MNSATVKDVLHHGPCMRYPKWEIERLFAGRESLTLKDAAELPIGMKDILWGVAHLCPSDLRGAPTALIISVLRRYGSGESTPGIQSYLSSVHNRRNKQPSLFVIDELRSGLGFDKDAIFYLSAIMQKEIDFFKDPFRAIICAYEMGYSVLYITEAHGEETSKLRQESSSLYVKHVISVLDSMWKEILIAVYNSTKEKQDAVY